MNRFSIFYIVLLTAFAVFLAYLQYTWYSVFVLGLSFCAYALFVGNNLKKTRDVSGR